MTQWMYYLVAVVAAGVVLLLVGKLTVEGTETAVNATSFQMVKKKQFAVVQTIERDFRNLGASRPDTAQVIFALESDTAGTYCSPSSPSSTCTVIFATRIDPDTLLADPSVGLIRDVNQNSWCVKYDWRYAFTDKGKITDDDYSKGPSAMKDITLVDWQRSVYQPLNAMSPCPDKASPDWAKTHEINTFSRFDVVALNGLGGGNLPGGLQDVRGFYIRAQALAPRGMGRDNVDVSSWETYVRPANLTRLDQLEEE